MYCKSPTRLSNLNMKRRSPLLPKHGLAPSSAVAWPAAGQGRALQAPAHLGVQLAGGGHPVIVGIDGAAGKDVAVGHEGVTGVALTKQNRRHVAVMAQQHQGGGILGAGRAWHGGVSSVAGPPS